MQFKITRSKYNECLKEYDEILKGFNIQYSEPITYTYYRGETTTFVKSGTVFIDSLESMLALQKKLGTALVISKDVSGDEDTYDLDEEDFEDENIVECIEIYDDYREI